MKCPEVFGDSRGTLSVLRGVSLSLESPLHSSLGAPLGTKLDTQWKSRGKHPLPLHSGKTEHGPALGLSLPIPCAVVLNEGLWLLEGALSLSFQSPTQRPTRTALGLPLSSRLGSQSSPPTLTSQCRGTVISPDLPWVGLLGLSQQKTTERVT